MEDKSGFVDAGKVDFSDKDAVLRAALENEVKGKELYLHYAKTVKSDMARKVFEHLAAEELTHISDIRAFLEAEEGVNVDDMTVSDSVGEARTIFGKLVSEFKEAVAPNDDDNKARDVSMEFEKNGYEYYRKGAEAATDEKLKKFLLWLMEQEQSHYVFIRNAFEYMNSPASWFAGEEGWLLEG